MVDFYGFHVQVGKYTVRPMDAMGLFTKSSNITLPQTPWNPASPVLAPTRMKPDTRPTKKTSYAKVDLIYKLNPGAQL